MTKKEEWWKERSDIPEELNDAPIVENHTSNIKNSEWLRLHKELAQRVIDFFKEHGLPEGSEYVGFNFDTLESSVEYGKWHAASDSCLVLKDSQDNTILSSM